jgi:von Willebrand factor type A domain
LFEKSKEIAMPSLERTTSAGRAQRLRGTFFLGALVAALVPSAVDCGGGSGDDDDNGSGSGFNCVDAFGTRCGSTCASDTACGEGLFCSNGACTAQCNAASGCGADRVCSVQGRCVPSGTNGASGAGGSGLPGTGGTGGGGGSGGGTSGSAGGGNCPDVSVQFRPIVPAIMLVADRSASMRCPIDDDAEVIGQCGSPSSAGPGSRWVTFRDGLLPFIQQQQENALFGVTFYPNGDGCGIAPVPAVPLLVGAHEEISVAYNSGANEPSGQSLTPTGSGVDAAVAEINATELPPNTPKFIILASDGSPLCGQGTEAAQEAAALTAVGDAFDSGIRTFVIAIGELFNANEDKEAQFREMADAGVGFGKPGGSAERGPLYFVDDPATLENALKSIINGVRPCSFDLDVALTNPQVDGPKGVVSIDNNPVTFNDPNGWRLADNDTIEFVGAACTSIQNGSTDVKASFPCGVETTPVPLPPPPPR